MLEHIYAFHIRPQLLCGFGGWLLTYCELRISENVNWASKHASFLGYNYYDKIN